MQIILDIPDSKASFFMELISGFSYVKVTKPTEGVLTPKQIQLIEETRRKVKESPASLIDWEVAKNQIDWDAC